MDPNFGKFNNNNNYPRNQGFGFDQAPPPSQPAMVNQGSAFGGHQVPPSHQMSGGFNQQPPIGFGGIDAPPINQFNNQTAPFTNYQQNQPPLNQGHNMNPYQNQGFNNNYQPPQNVPNAPPYQNFQNPQVPNAYQQPNNQYYAHQQPQMPPQQTPQHFMPNNQYQGNFNQQYNAGNSWNQNDYIRNVFNQFDLDRNNFITMDELAMALNQLTSNFQFDRQTLGLILRRFDLNSDNRITFEEFNQLYAYLNDEYAKFLISDVDSNGSIDSSELANGLANRGIRINPQCVQFVVNRVQDIVQKRITFDIYCRVNARFDYLCNCYAKMRHYPNESLEQYLTQKFFAEF